MRNHGRLADRALRQAAESPQGRPGQRSHGPPQAAPGACPTPWGTSLAWLRGQLVMAQASHNRLGLRTPLETRDGG